MITFDERDLYTGLAALHWSAYDEPAWDHDFYKRVVEEVGGLALDVGCGAGRLLRLIAFERVVLDPGESRQVAFRADPRLLARFDGAAGRWRITGGTHEIAVGRSATDLVLRGHTELAARHFGA